MAETENLTEWRGKQLVDRDGNKIGKLQDVYVDTETDEQLFGTVKEGLVGRHLTFVPLRGAVVSPDCVTVHVSKKDVKHGPNLDTEGELTQADERELFDHFGFDYRPPITDSGRLLGRR